MSYSINSKPIYHHILLDGTYYSLDDYHPHPERKIQVPIDKYLFQLKEYKYLGLIGKEQIDHQDKVRLARFDMQNCGFSIEDIANATELSPTLIERFLDGADIREERENKIMEYCAWECVVNYGALWADQLYQLNTFRLLHGLDVH